ncbi:unnamed protein product [Candidula unifasciata]|uniref:Uncharacterized protein n=1 Tax=Candidula unifasciata TaxID=100452 RepID=A0A8S3ZBT9_9EUPU|nr:unnamed protein product [Candidula unifasciata]
MLKDQSQEPLIPENKPNMVVPKRKLSKMLKIGGVICAVAVILIVISALATGGRISTKTNNVIISKSGFKLLALNGVSYNKNSNSFTFSDRELKKDYLNIHFSYEFVNGEAKKASNCHVDSREKEPFSSPGCSQRLNMEFKNNFRADIHEIDLDGLSCHSVQWHTKNRSAEITNCFLIEDNWYGGGGLSVQRWPLNRVNVPLQPHLTQKYKVSRPSGSADQVRFDSFIEPYFISAGGAAVLFDHFLPLFISMNHENDKKLCFTSEFKKPYASVSSDDSLSLQYLVCKDQKAKSIHQRMLKMSKIPFYQGAPEIGILRKPVWSTRGLEKPDISETSLLSFVNNIKSNKLAYGHLFIDGNYSRSSGNFYFNEKIFPHSHQLIMELMNSPEEDKLPVGIEVFPYVLTEKSDLFAVHYVNTSSLNQNQNRNNFLDVTNENALKWYTSHLKDVTEQVNLRGLRFSGAFAVDLVEGLDQASLITNKTLHHLSMFTKKFSEVAQKLHKTSLIGSGYGSQIHTFIADAGPMMSSWEHNKGLKSVIPTTLTYGIMGYPFSLMGPIGGVNIDSDTSSNPRKPPEKELFIRWLQLATYLPVMELSAGPWLYDQEVVNYTQRLLSFRSDELWPNLLSSAVEEAIKLGTPIARPLWWIAAEDKIAQFIDCEFFLGDSLLVAPVLYANARHRDVYLPEGSLWRDQLRGSVYKGGQWLRQYPVGLYEIATFRRDMDSHNKH